MSSYGIILFDGVCNLCNGAVNFIIDHDPTAYFNFAPLQSESGQRLQQELALPPHLDTLILIEGQHVYTQSTAVLRIARKLSLPWSLAVILLSLPRGLRNAAYRQIARKRYKWFGKSTQCRLPTPALKARFLN